MTILQKQVAEFNVAHVVDSTQGMPQNALAASRVAITPAWTYPPPGSVKLNCDGAWAAKIGQGSGVEVVREALIRLLGIWV
ncbi:unnamed protein product [Prunus brigantina]